MFNPNRICSNLVETTSRDLSGLVSAVLSILHHYLDISEQVKRTNFKFIDTIKDDIS